MILNVHATVSSNSLRYFDYMVANYINLVCGQNEVRFFAYCLDDASARSLASDVRLHDVVRLGYGAGSSGHARAIEAALQNARPKEINIIADTDVVLLRKNWDLQLVEELVTARRYGIVATRLEDIGGFSTGDTPYQQYKKKPSTTWMALSPHYDFTTLRVHPDKAEFIEIATAELSELYNLPMGFFVVKDTGWQIPSFLSENKIPYFALDIVKPSSPEAKALAGVNSYHDEFQWSGSPFLVHQRGSMTHRFRIDPLSVDFYDACDRYLGNPAWAIHASSGDRVRARLQDVGRLAKKAAKSARAAFRKLA